VFGALLTGSLALLADAGHMLTDAAGLVIALIAASLALRPATAQRTWGYRRAEVHRVRRMGEHPELAAAEAKQQVLGSDDGPGHRVSWWVTEHELPAGVVGGYAEQRGAVRVAADDAVQDDDVGGFNCGGVRGDVNEAALHPVGRSCLGEQPGSLSVVGLRQLNVGVGRRAAPQQLELDLADPTADLQDSRVLHRPD
jgi:hypothetical protein